MGTDTRHSSHLRSVHRPQISQALSGREFQVTELLYEGYSNKEIGRRLGISDRTVEVHRAKIFLKIGVRNVTELVRLMAGDPKSG